MPHHPHRSHLEQKTMVFHNHHEPQNTWKFGPQFKALGKFQIQQVKEKNVDIFSKAGRPQRQTAKLQGSTRRKTDSAEESSKHCPRRSNLNCRGAKKLRTRFVPIAWRRGLDNCCPNAIHVIRLPVIISKWKYSTRHAKALKSSVGAPMAPQQKQQNAQPKILHAEKPQVSPRLSKSRRTFLAFSKHWLLFDFSPITHTRLTLVECELRCLIASS